jgi:hypothetical protein
MSEFLLVRSKGMWLVVQFSPNEIRDGVVLYTFGTRREAMAMRDALAKEANDVECGVGQGHLSQV